MLKYISLFILIIIFSSNITCNAQDENWNYLFAGSRINDIIQDENDYWLATTTGLKKYTLNTGEITHYTKNNSNIHDHFIHSIALDSEKNIWMASDDHGLIKFDGESFTNYNTENSDIPSNTIIVVNVDQNDRVFGGTFGSGFFTFKNEEFENYDFANSGFPISTISDIAFDDDGNSWMATTPKIQSSGTGLIQFNGTDFQEYNTGNSNIPHNGIKSVTVDSENNIWVASKQTVGKFTNNQVWEEIPELGGVAPSGIRSIDIDQNGIPWVATFQDGLGSLVNNIWTLNTPIDQPLQVALGTIYVDNNQRIWGCSYTAGLFSYENQVFSNHNLSNSELDSDIIQNIQLDIDGRVWILGRFEIVVKDQNEWITFNSTDIGIDLNYFLFLAIDRNGIKWIGYLDSDQKIKILRYDNSNWSTHSLSFDGSISGFSYLDLKLDKNGTPKLAIINDFFEFNGFSWIQDSNFNNEVVLSQSGFDNDSEGNIWVSTRFDLFKYDGTSFQSFPLETVNPASNLTTEIIVDNEDNIWIATNDGRLIKHNVGSSTVTDTLELENPFFPSFIPYMMSDSEGRLWVIHHSLTEAEVYKKEEGEWTYFNTQNSGLMGNRVIEIMEDQENNFWFNNSMPFGISIFNMNGVSVTTEEAFSNTNNSTFSNLRQFPNPTKEIITISYQVEELVNLSLNLYNNLGQLNNNIFKDKQHQKGLFKKTLNLNKLIPGIYFLKLEDDNGLSSIKKIVITF